VNLAILLKQPLLKKTLLKHLAYYADGWYVFEDKKTPDGKEKDRVTELYDFKSIDASKAKIVIVAKIHYRQSSQSYTSVSKKELQQILTLQKGNENTAATIFQVISNSAIDGYDIKKTIFDETLINELGEQRILIPETELLSLEEEQQDSLTNNQAWLTSVDTPVGKLFVSCFADKNTSSYAKGLLSNIDAFKLSSGLPSDILPTHIETESYANFLFNCLVNKSIDQLYRKLAFNVKKWFKVQDLHLLYWAPLLTATAFYLLTNSYLWFQNATIENELADHGSKVSTLLNNKYQQDQQSQLLHLLNTEFSKTSTVHEHWSLIYQLVESDMQISRISFSENLLTVRGRAPNASKVLASIAKKPYVNSATFKGSVVKSKGQESFTLELITNKSTSIVSVEKKTDSDKDNEKPNVKAEDKAQETAE
jgi:hypothetical protein